MNIEHRLFEIEGDVAGKLHTARSRNDQVTTDVRMFTRDIVSKAIHSIHQVQGSLLDQAEANITTIMPGYTHLQRAQPVLLAHHFMAYFEMFSRDIERMHDCHRRVNILPLGSGALAGVPYPIDRSFIADELGFEKVSDNSMDAVSDRDYIVDFISASALCMMHCSRLAEELIIWSSQEFGFISLSTEWTVGSSIMPQKRNPDFAELARGKTGRVYGSLMSVLTTLKGLPLTYNRDLQEDKEPLFDTADTLVSTLEVFADMIRTMTVKIENMKNAASDGTLLATDLADYLAKKGLPFREAHTIVDAICQAASKQNVLLSDLSLENFKSHSIHFDEDIFEITTSGSIAARNIHGATSESQVRQSIAVARKRLEDSL